jgi:hypothetical protein
MPMVTIGLGLQELGHRITVLTGAHLCDAVAAAGLDAVALPDGVQVDPPAAPPDCLRRLPAPVRRFWLGRAELKAVYAEPLVEQATSVRKILRANSVDAILADLTFTGVLPILLNDLARPPILVCGVSPLTLTSADTPPFGLAWRPVSGFDYRRMNTVAHRVIMRGSQRVFERATVSSS